MYSWGIKLSMINLSIFFPTTFFLTFTILKNHHRLPFLLFTGLFLDKIIYNLPFLNTILLLLFLGLSHCFKKKNNLNDSILQTTIYTGLYYLFWTLYLQKNLISFFFFALVWNVLFTIIFYEKDSIKLK